MTSKFIKAKRVVQKIRAKHSPATTPNFRAMPGARSTNRVPVTESFHLQLGVCRYCGCTDEHPCALDDGANVRACWWVDKNRTICSNPECWEQWKRDCRRAQKKGVK